MAVFGVNAVSFDSLLSSRYVVHIILYILYITVLYHTGIYMTLKRDTIIPSMGIPVD